MSKQAGLNDIINLCAFMVEADGKAYSWKRFKIAIYALSIASEREKMQLAHMFSYDFDSDCYAGPDDDDLRFDLEWLIAAQYFSERTMKLPGTAEHSFYELNKKGKELGLAAIGYLNDNQRVSVEKVARSFKDDSNTVVALLRNYAREWDQSQKELIEKLTSAGAPNDTTIY